MLHMGQRGQTRRTQWRQLLVSISFLSRVISKSLLTTSDDLSWPCRDHWAKLHPGHSEWAKITWFWINQPDPMHTFIIRSICLFSHSLIMGRSGNWPDLRSPISKIWDIQTLDSHALMKPCKYETNLLKTVALVEPQTFSEVGALDLAWWPDLTWPIVKTFLKAVQKMIEQVLKIWRRYAPPFFRYLGKTWGGCLNTPPARRGLI